VALAIALSPSGQHSGWQTRLIALAVLAFLNVLIYFLWLPRQLRRKMAKALRVNSSDG
jgi:cyanate permease